MIFYIPSCIIYNAIQATVDIFFSTVGGIKLTTKGGKNEVHVLGYFEPEEESYVSDSDEEDLEDAGDEEDESDDEPANKRKNTNKEE